MSKFEGYNGYDHSRLRATIAGHEGLMSESADVIESLHTGKHDPAVCKECNIVMRLRKFLTGLKGDC